MPATPAQVPGDAPKWTAGPWQIRMPHGYARSVTSEHAEGDGVIADFGECDDSDNQVMANARLIAAAPELYAACEAALGAFERNDAIDWDILSRALAKARGEQP